MVAQKIVDHYADMDIDELEMEFEDLSNAIMCEEYRANHAYSDASIAKHMKTIGMLKEERAYVYRLIKELMAG